MTRSWPSGLLAALAFGALAGCGAGSSHAANAAPPPARAFSPYVDVTLGGGSGLAAQSRAAGLRSVTLAFVDGSPRSCRATWGGQPLGAVVTPADVRALGAAGASPVVSFGGRDGPELAASCSSVSALAAQYLAVVGAYRPTRLDFDIEGRAVADAAANARRWAALRIVLARSPRGATPVVSLTVPVDPTGIPGTALAMLRGALTAGVRPAQVNLLAMDYGTDFPSSRRPMSVYAERAAAAAARQLRGVYGGGAGYGRVGLTVMVGVNDTPGETFTPADARAVASFATAHRLGGLSMWSLGRDRPCPPSTPPGAQPTCSGVAQSPLAFSRLLGR